MAEPADKPTTIRVRGSRARIEAVRKTAERAELQLAREQDDSAGHMTRALDQITQGEDLAHLDGRITFAERQIERLASRREESDRLIAAELSVMRVRLEDTLSAFAAATQEHRDVMASSERRLQSLAVEAERTARGLVDSLRAEVASKVDEAVRGAARQEARLAGEHRIVADEAAKRATALAGTLAAGRQALDAQVSTALAAVDARVEAALSRLEAASPQAPGSLLQEVEARLEECLGEPLAQIERLREDLSAAIAAAPQGGPAREARTDLLVVLQASEDKALAAAEHLESMIHQVRRRLVSDEAEWSAIVGEAGDAMAALRGRAEDLLARVCSLEAAGASERGTAGAQLGGINRRLDQHEEWAQVSIAETAALARRIAAAEAQVGSLAEVRRLIEEQVGAIQYLRQRLEDVSERLDAPALAVATQPDARAQPGNGAGNGAGRDGPDLKAFAEVLPRLKAVEGALSALYGVQPAPGDPAGRDALAGRLDGLALGHNELVSRLNDIEARLGAPEVDASAFRRRRR